MKRITGLILAIVVVMNFFTTTVCAEETKKWETPSGISSEEIERVCDEAFSEYIGDSIAGGAIAIVKNGEIVFEKGYGYGDIENQILVDPKTTVFEYGSVTKLFTWTSAMQLAEQGKIDLNADIREYLPDDFKLNMKFDKPITMLDLMNHQAGFDDYVIRLFCDENNIPDLKSSLYEHQVDQIYEPGFASSYSNYSAALAGYIVECVSKEPMYQYVQKNILDVAGMEHTTINPDISTNEYIKEHKSFAYEMDDNGDLTKARWSYIPLYPAGSANGTIEELAKFGIALCKDGENPVLFKNKDGVNKLLSTSYCVNEEVSGIAHGFIEYDGEYNTYWHNGGTQNFSTFFAVVPEADYAIALVANTEAGISLIQNLGFQTVQKKEVTLEKPENNLPNTKIVEGKYMDFRQVHHGISQLLYLFPETMNVLAVNDTQISIDGDLYTQIKPYLYQNVETGMKCAFVVEDGKVVKYSNMLDNVPVTWKENVKWYTTYAVMLYFIVSLVSLAIYLVSKFIRKKHRDKKQEEKGGLKKGKWIIFSIVGYLILFINIFIIVNKISSWENFSSIRHNILVNYVIGAFIMLSNGKVIISVKQINNRWMKLIYGNYVISNLLLFITLGVWGVFNFMK